MKRSHIAAHYLSKYPVAKDIEQILDELSFKEFFSSQVPRWQMFTRTFEGNNEFAATYPETGNKEFLVHGQYSKIEVPQGDLENIANILDEGLFSRIVRHHPMQPLIWIAAGIGIESYDLLHYYLNGSNDNLSDLPIMNAVTGYLRTLDPSATEQEAFFAANMLYFLGIVGGMVLHSVGLFAANGLLNRHYGSKLSPEAENYKYGWDAEERLRKEFDLERVKAGKLSTSNFIDTLNMVEE